MTLDDLIAKDAVADLALGYVRAIDEKDWDGFLALFTPEVEIDAAVVHGGPAVRLSREDWLARARSTIERFETTLHYITNLQVEVTGDTAVCRSYAYAVHGRTGDRPEERFVVHGQYTHRAQRTAEGWRLSGMRLDFSFRDGEVPKG